MNFVRYCIAGVWHRVDFVRWHVAADFYTTVSRLVPRHASACELTIDGKRALSVGGCHV